MNDLNFVFLQNNCFELSPGLFHVANRLKDLRSRRSRRDIPDRNYIRRNRFGNIRWVGRQTLPVIASRLLHERLLPCTWFSYCCPLLASSPRARRQSHRPVGRR